MNEQFDKIFADLLELENKCKEKSERIADTKCSINNVNKENELLKKTIGEQEAKLENLVKNF
jgi:hypothetical protein